MTATSGRPVKRISWVRPVEWCAKHGMAWASHSEWGIFIDPGCERFERWVEDLEKLDKLGPPQSNVSEGDPFPTKPPTKPITTPIDTSRLFSKGKVLRLRLYVVVLIAVVALGFLFASCDPGAV